LLARYQQGDSKATDELFHRYLNRLTQLARSRLSPRLAQRVDAEDVVLSAYRSFFVGARDGRFSLQRSGDLWRLLVAITLRKLHRQAAHHTAGKRSYRREEPLSVGNSAPDPEQFVGEPSPTEALAVADELEHIMNALDPVKRRVLELRLLDWTLDRIAADIGRSERTVRRLLDELFLFIDRHMKLD
jgi:RNA polymerase sigma factor (sigma-70 family)